MCTVPPSRANKRPQSTSALVLRGRRCRGLICSVLSADGSADSRVGLVVSGANWFQVPIGGRPDWKPTFSFLCSERLSPSYFLVPQSRHLDGRRTSYFREVGGIGDASLLTSLASEFRMSSTSLFRDAAGIWGSLTSYFHKRDDLAGLRQMSTFTKNSPSRTVGTRDSGECWLVHGPRTTRSCPVNRLALTLVCDSRVATRETVTLLPLRTSSVWALVLPCCEVSEVPHTNRT